MLTDIARTDPLTAAPETTVGAVAAVMRTADETLVAVLDEQHPLGVVLAADIGRAVGTVDDLESRPISGFVSEPVTIRERASREGLLSRFRETGVDRLVVVDDADEFVGVVCREDALAAYADEFTTLLDLF